MTRTRRTPSWRVLGGRRPRRTDPAAQWRGLFHSATELFAARIRHGDAVPVRGRVHATALLPAAAATHGAARTWRVGSDRPGGPGRTRWSSARRTAAVAATAIRSDAVGSAAESQLGADHHRRGRGLPPRGRGCRSRRRVAEQVGRQQQQQRDQLHEASTSQTTTSSKTRTSTSRTAPSTSGTEWRVSTADDPAAGRLWPGRLQGDRPGHRCAGDRRLRKEHPTRRT